MHLRSFLAVTALLPALVYADVLLVKNDEGQALAQVMVTQSPTAPPAADLSDDGYAPDGVTNTGARLITRFTDDQGRVSFDPVWCKNGILTFKPLHDGSN